MKYFVLSLLLGAVVLIQACTENNSSKKTENSATSETVAINGEALFVRHCKQCHLPKEDFTAPALVGVEARWEKKEDLYAFIKNSQEVIVRNKYAKDLFEQWNQAPMLPFPNLSRADIDAILEYCNQ